MTRAFLEARTFVAKHPMPQMEPNPMSPSDGMHGRDPMQVDPTERVIQENRSDNPDVDVTMSDAGDMSTVSVVFVACKM